jgi:hypothetical protein
LKRCDLPSFDTDYKVEVWILAAFLSLPKRPPAYASPDALPSTAQMSEYGSQAYPNSIVPSEVSVDEKRWQKAKWWRTVNRIMSILGLLIIGAVVRKFRKSACKWVHEQGM